MPSKTKKLQSVTKELEHTHSLISRIRVRKNVKQLLSILALTQS